MVPLCIDRSFYLVSFEMIFFLQNSQIKTEWPQGSGDYFIALYLSMSEPL